MKDAGLWVVKELEICLCMWDIANLLFSADE